jgi:hypothetical protein
MNDLKDALSRVADASAPGPIALERVRGRARQLRRRRTTTGVIASVVAVAAVAGVGVAVAPSGSHRDSLPPATQTPDPTPTRTPTKAGADEVGPVFPVTLAVDADHTFGGEPQVPYWSDGRIVDTDGTTTPFPDRPFRFAKDPSTGGWVVVRAGEAMADLVRITPDGRQVGPAVPTFERGLAVGPRGELVTITQDGTQRVLTAGDRTIDLGEGLEWTQLYGVLQNGDVLFQGPEGGVMVVHPGTGRIEALPETSSAAVARGTGLTAYGRNDGTWVAQREDGTAQWSVDWAGVSSFSPNGRYVALVGDPRHRIAGSVDWDSDHATGTLWIRTASDLLPVAAFTAPENAYFGAWTWDGDDLLATLFDRDRGEWSLVRLGQDGFRVGRGTGQEGGGEEPAYVFAAQ